MARLRSRLLRLLLIVVVVLAAAAGAGALWVRGQLAGSLPLLDGELVLTGLAAPVRVERDALGIPTITATSAEDAARALGFLHAQERFFQMDLQRRKPAGELAALVGSAALEADRSARRHGFLDVAVRAFAKTPAADRARYTAYAEGVNAGLAALDRAPFEYQLLRTTPESWRPEDAILSGLAM